MYDSPPPPPLYVPWFTIGNPTHLHNRKQNKKEQKQATLLTICEVNGLVYVCVCVCEWPHVHRASVLSFLIFLHPLLEFFSACNSVRGGFRLCTTLVLHPSSTSL